VADILEENDFSVLEAKDADAALKLLESQPDVKLLFTDVQMPGSLNGMELARDYPAASRRPRISFSLRKIMDRPCAWARYGYRKFPARALTCAICAKATSKP
jgi:CheY-like chemotaxis protein